jgi:hypothetical protein
MLSIQAGKAGIARCLTLPEPGRSRLPERFPKGSLGTERMPKAECAALFRPAALYRENPQGKCRAGALACSFNEQPGAAVPHFFILGGEVLGVHEGLACACTGGTPAVPGQGVGAAPPAPVARASSPWEPPSPTKKPFRTVAHGPSALSKSEKIRYRGPPCPPELRAARDGLPAYGRLQYP